MKYVRYLSRSAHDSSRLIASIAMTAVASAPSAFASGQMPRSVSSMAVPGGAAVAAGGSALGSSAPSAPPKLPGGAISVVLYAYETCPFCNKVRAYLDAVKVPYVLVEVDPLRKRELAWWPAYQKVPLAVVNGAVVSDSSQIIDAIDTLLQAGGGAESQTPRSLPLKPMSPLARGDNSGEARRRAWVDDVLVKLLTVNIYRTPSEALGTLDYLTKRNFPSWSVTLAKYVGAAAMYGVARSRLAALKLPSGVDERRALVDALNTFISDMGEKPFCGGHAPDISDVCVFGVLRAIDGLPTHTEALDISTARPWYDRMAKAVGKSSLTHRVFEAPPLQ